MHMIRSARLFPASGKLCIMLRHTVSLERVLFSMVPIIYYHSLRFHHNLPFFPLRGDFTA